MFTTWGDASFTNIKITGSKYVLSTESSRAERRVRASKCYDASETGANNALTKANQPSKRITKGANVHCSVQPFLLINRHGAHADAQQWLKTTTGHVNKYFILLLLLLFFRRETYFGWGTRWRSWLRHCAKSRKAAGSIPNGVTGIFH